MINLSEDTEFMSLLNDVFHTDKYDYQIKQIPIGNYYEIRFRHQPSNSPLCIGKCDCTEEEAIRGIKEIMNGYRNVKHWKNWEFD